MEILSRQTRPTNKLRRRILAFGAGLALAMISQAPRVAHAEDPAPAAAQAQAKVGDSLPDATIRDASDKPAPIPDLGQKVLLIMYTDPDDADQNDPFADAVKAKVIDKDYFKSVGIANMKDAPAKPNWIIRAIVRSKIKKYNVTILTDPDRLLPTAWHLGDCNNKSVVLLIDKSRKLRFFKKGRLSDAEQAEALRLIDELVADAKAGK
ncbi:MAG: YtfJ family protein [Polyangia bacterium]